MASLHNLAGEAQHRATAEVPAPSNKVASAIDAKYNCGGIPPNQRVRGKFQCLMQKLRDKTNTNALSMTHLRIGMLNRRLKWARRPKQIVSDCLQSGKVESR
jgi:hypothetical protein